MQQLEFNLEYGSKDRPPIVALVGPRGSGKDTAFGFIAGQYPGAVRLAFADPLKKAAADLDHTTLDQVEANKEDYRSFLQDLGDLVRRELDDSLVKLVELDVVANSRAPIIVLTDTRRKAEEDLVRCLGGRVIRIDRFPEQEYRSGIDDHITETELDEIQPDCIVVNHDGDLDCFRRETLNAVEWAVDSIKATHSQSALSAN